VEESDIREASKPIEEWSARASAPKAPNEMLYRLRGEGESVLQRDNRTIREHGEETLRV